MRNKVNRLEEIFMRLVEGTAPARRSGERSQSAYAPRRRRELAVSSVVSASAPPVNLSLVRWVGFKTIVIREYGRIIRIWGQTWCRRRSPRRCTS